MLLGHGIGTPVGARDRIRWQGTRDQKAIVPLAVFPEDILSTHWVPKEIRLDDERTSFRRRVIGALGLSAVGVSRRLPQNGQSRKPRKRTPSNWCGQKLKNGTH